MANLASSGVTITNSYEAGNRASRFVHKVVFATVVLSAMGTATNQIPASAFGLSKILAVSNLTKSDNTEVIPAAVSTNGTLILLKKQDAFAPQDATGTYNLRLEGY